jgi:hypothetical protein
MILNLGADELLTTTRAVRRRLDLERPVEREVIESTGHLVGAFARRRAAGQNVASRTHDQTETE